MEIISGTSRSGYASIVSRSKLGNSCCFKRKETEQNPRSNDKNQLQTQPTIKKFRRVRDSKIPGRHCWEANPLSSALPGSGTKLTGTNILVPVFEQERRLGR